MGLYQSAIRLFTSLLATRTTSPPRPPSPPLGPPLGTNFSLRKARQPLPPSPALTRILTSSMNNDSRALLRGTDADEFAVPAAVAELNDTGDFGEQRVVLAQAHVLTRLNAGAALPDDDRTAGHQLAAEGLHAQTLRIRIAPVFGTSQTFLMCHDLPYPISFTWTRVKF